MMPNRQVAGIILTAWFVLVPPAVALAAPGSTAPKCADQIYRQAHLRECNMGGSPGIGVGAGGGSGGGLLGAVRDLVGGLTGGIL